MEWISVKEKLPKCGKRQRYLVIADGIERTVLYREYYDGWDFEPEYGEVTYWQPLPPPPSSHNSDYAKCLYELWEHIESNAMHGSFMKSSVAEILKKHFA